MINPLFLLLYFSIIAMLLLLFGKCSTTFNISCKPILKYYDGITTLSTIYDKRIVNDKLYYKLKINVEYNDKICYMINEFSTSNTTVLNKKVYVYDSNFFGDCNFAEKDIKMHTNEFNTGIFLLIILIIFVIIGFVEKWYKQNIIQYTNINNSEINL